MTAVLQFAWQVWQVARRLPLSAWAVAGLVVLLGAARCERGAYGEREYQRGVADAKQGAAMDSMLRARVVRSHEDAKAHTDTVVRRVVLTRTKVDTLVQQVPDSVRQLPEIRRLLIGVTVLTTQVDTLLRALDTERAIGQLRASVDSTAIVSLTTQRNVLSLENRQLNKRPRWRHVAGAVVAGALVGVAAGRMR